MKKTILILVANPQGSGSLNLWTEVRNLQEAIQRSLNKERFTIEPRFAVRREDFRRFIGSPGIGRETVAYDTILARTVTQKSLSGKGSSSLAP